MNNYVVVGSQKFHFRLRIEETHEFLEHRGETEHLTATYSTDWNCL